MKATISTGGGENLEAMVFNVAYVPQFQLEAGKIWRPWCLMLHCIGTVGVCRKIDLVGINFHVYVCLKYTFIFLVCFVVTILGHVVNTEN